MHVISVQGSQTQKSKLRNGHKVRVKHGSGFNVVVNPSTYHIVSRAFLKNKGVSLQLSPEEIAMNKAPSPEMQQQIMGHKEHMVIPGVIDHINKGGRGLGTGVTDWFKNIGNKIKGGLETVKEKVFDPVYKPIERNIVNPLKEQYEKYVPEEYRRDIDTASKFMSPANLALDLGKRTARGEKPQEIMKDYFERAKHLNATKNKIIKSNPALTEAYKKGVMATAGLGSAAVGSAFGLSPATGALAGLAATKGAEELLKAEGYGLHHAIDIGMRHAFHKLKKHYSPIEGGTLGAGHFKDFFKHAGKTVKSIANFGGRQAKKLNEFVLNNPALGKKIVEHGSKLAGLLAKEGVKYLTGDEKLGEMAGNVGTDLGEKGLKKAGYGEEKPKPPPPPKETKKEPIAVSQYPPMPYHNDKPKYIPIASTTPAYTTMPKQHSPLQHNSNAYLFTSQEMANKGKGLYAGRQRGYGLEPPSRLIGAGNWSPESKKNYFDQTHQFQPAGYKPPPPPPRIQGGGRFKSFQSIHDANMGYSNANADLARMQDMTVMGQHEAEPIRSYYNEVGEPPSRGYGIKKMHHGKIHHRRKTGFERHNHYNLIRGRGTIIEHSQLPPALQSQPYGANFHMQNMLPPQYQKYNDGTNEY